MGVEELLFNDEQAMTHQLFEQIKTKIVAIDATLAATAEGEKMKVLKSIEMLAQKAAKAQKKKQAPQLRVYLQGYLKTAFSMLLENSCHGK